MEVHKCVITLCILVQSTEPISDGGDGGVLKERKERKVSPYCRRVWWSISPVGGSLTAETTITGLPSLSTPVRWTEGREVEGRRVEVREPYT